MQAVVVELPKKCMLSKSAFLTWFGVWGSLSRIVLASPLATKIPSV